MGALRSRRSAITLHPENSETDVKQQRGSEHGTHRGAHLPPRYLVSLAWGSEPCPSVRCSPSSTDRPPAPARLPCPRDLEKQGWSSSCGQAGPQKNPPSLWFLWGLLVFLPREAGGWAGLAVLTPATCSVLPGGHSIAFLGPHREDLLGTRETRACIPVLQATL